MGGKATLQKNGRVRVTKLISRAQLRRIRLERYFLYSRIIPPLLLLLILLVVARPFLLISRHGYLYDDKSYTDASQSRFTRAPTWRDVDKHGNNLTLPLTIEEAGNRAFLSVIGNDSSDGLGHRFLMVNFELNMAHHLRAGYVHRVARYASLTATDSLTVERLFGWIDYPYLRSDILSGCEIKTTVQPCDGGPYAATECRHLLSHHTSNTSIYFDRIVRVPDDLSECLAFTDVPRYQCIQHLQQFARSKVPPRTLLQMTNTLCGSEYRDSNFEHSGRWLRERYWRFHNHSTMLDPITTITGTSLTNSLRTRSPSKSLKISPTRILPFTPSRIQLVVHIRRGDFLFLKNRRLISDAAYAASIATVLRALRLSTVEQDVKQAGIDISIFSEGIPHPHRGRNVVIGQHDVNRMSVIYVTESGQHVQNATDHWLNLVASQQPPPPMQGVDVNVFIATDTVQAVHAMLCADVFIGSESGLSMHVVATLARGIVILPDQPKKKDLITGRTLRFHTSLTQGDTFNVTNFQKCIKAHFPGGSLT